MSLQITFSVKTQNIAIAPLLFIMCFFVSLIMKCLSFCLIKLKGFLFCGFQDSQQPALVLDKKEEPDSAPSVSLDIAPSSP